MPIFFKNDKKLFFIHIPKCGGTSIEKYLSVVSGGMEFFSHDQHKIFPCTPQHIDRTLIQSLFFQGTNDFQYVTVVRHPFSRIISEYFHANRYLEKPADFDRWLPKALKKASHNMYINDNHLRNQVDFLVESAVVFNFENGLNMPIKFALKTLNITKPIEDIPHERKYKKHNITISKKSINMINHFYQKDFDFFGYKMINFDRALKNEDIKKLNLRSQIKDGYTVLERCKNSDLNNKFNLEFKYNTEPTLSQFQKNKTKIKKIIMNALGK